MNPTTIRRLSTSVLAAVCELILCSALGTSLAHAYVVVRDQYAPSRENAGDWSLAFGTRELGQSFSVTVAGYLDSFELYINRQTNSDGAMQWDIRDTVAGLPSAEIATVHASGSLAIADLPRYWDRTPVTFDLKPFHIRVQPGDEYAITIHTSGGGEAFWLYSLMHPPGFSSAHFASDPWQVDTFANGARAYATYVALVPEPATVATLLTGGLALLGRRRR